MGKLGVAFSHGLNASDTVECAMLAESLGYESVWMAEGHGGDQFAVLAAVATQTKKVRLGTCISSVYVRSAPTIAMAAATVDQLSDGRFILGLGSSHKVQVTPEHGVPYGKPVTRVRETVELTRQLLRDGQVQYHGTTFTIENYELWFAPLRADLPIYLSALFPKMLGVCGEIADGAILTRTTLETSGEMRGHVVDGAKAAGRNPDDVEITSLIPAAMAPDRAVALDALRPGVAMYTGFFPRYNRMSVAHGFADESIAIAEAWQSGDREGATKLVSDALIDSFCIGGTAQQCRDKIEAYWNAGLDLPLIAPTAFGDDPKAEVEALIKACAPG